MKFIHYRGYIIDRAKKAKTLEETQTVLVEVIAHLYNKAYDEERKGWPGRQR